MRAMILDAVRYCAAPNCTRILVRKRYGDRLEDRTVFLRRRFCNPTCTGSAHRKSEPTRDAHRKRVHHLKKDACERCGTRERLSVHHKDRNWRNDADDNIATLCASCHTTLHHEQGDIVGPTKLTR